MLQQSDLDALLAVFAATQEAEVSLGSQQRVKEVKIFDFAQPENLPSEFLHALENINSTFARTLSGMLSGYLSTGVQVDPLSADQMTYRQFCNSVPEMTAIGTFSLSPFEGLALYEMNPHLAWYLIECGLGGKGKMIESMREYTPLEKGLLDEVVFRRILHELSKAWKTLFPLRMTLRDVVNNPVTARIAHPDDRMVVCTFGINMADMNGMSTYCIPVSSLDFERLLNPDMAWDENGMKEIDDDFERAQVVHNMLQTHLSMRVCLPDIEINLGELNRMKLGDVLHLDAKTTRPLEVRIGDNRCFIANPVILDDQLAVELLDEWHND